MLFKIIITLFYMSTRKISKNTLWAGFHGGAYENAKVIIFSKQDSILTLPLPYFLPRKNQSFIFSLENLYTCHMTALYKFSDGITPIMSYCVSQLYDNTSVSLLGLSNIGPLLTFCCSMPIIFYEFITNFAFD